MKATTEISTSTADAAAPEKLAPTHLASLSPAYFGMVMATGIVSLAAHQSGLPRLANGLFLLNTGAYGVLWLLFLLRMIRYPSHFFGDMIHHLRGPGFFTVVAATGILGAQFVLLATDHRVGLVLWVATLLLWVALTYTIFTGLTVKRQKPSLDKGINGAWLLAVVATQAIAVLSALLAAHAGHSSRLEMNFLALSMWLWGGMLYIWMMSLIFYRYTFFSLAPSDLAPPYWINMGAMAISTLAGSLLMSNAADAPFLASMLPFIKGFTVFYWATGTWWIPMLIILALWRHAYKKFPLQYNPLYWGAVFPLGMYAVCTEHMVQALELGFLAFLPTACAYIALLAWAATFFGLLSHLLRHASSFRL